DWVPKCDYFLYVSWIDHYKAQLELVRGFNLYYQRGGKEKLLFVGAEYSLYADLVRQEIVNLGLLESVKLIGNVPHEELPAAYQNARINIFASFTENCPNILLEMMASGRPALVSNYGPMPEFGRDAVEYFDSASPEAFAMQLSKLAGDNTLQSHLANAATKEAEKYTWEHAAQLTWNAIKNTKGNGGYVC
ncbi:MAG: glycosyltransferase, partial [Sediminibacterium sp.]